MINLKDNELLLRCDCHSSDHIAFLIHDPDDGDHSQNPRFPESDDWYLSFLLDPITPWYKRVWRALRPHSGRYGAYAELVLKNEDAEKVAQFILARLVGRELARKEAEATE